MNRACLSQESLKSLNRKRIAKEMISMWKQKEQTFKISYKSKP